MRKWAAGLFILATLGGCSSLFGPRASLDIQPVGKHDPAAGVIALEEGRDHLRAGNPGMAIVSLQIATGDPASVADAHNALGVAYAMLGRGDLAERYFQRAIAENPDEPKFAANLARYYRSREAMTARVETPVDVPAKLSTRIAIDQPAERTMQAGPGIVLVSTPVRNIAVTRVSAREVAIATASAVPDPGPDGRSRNPSFAAVAKTPARAPAYPVRIELAAVGTDR